MICSILKLDISRNFKDSHPENIEFVLFTDEVLKVDKSIISKDVQFENIFSIHVTLLVSKEDKSIDFNELHP